MGIFSAFKRKPKAPAVETDLKQELDIPPPPPPPSKDVTKELPGFPKLTTKQDKTPHLPSLGVEVKHFEKKIEVPKPQQLEPRLEHKELQKRFPKISPFELEPSLKRFEAPKPKLQEKVVQKRVVEEQPHYERVVSEVKRALHKPESFVKEPIFVNIEEYRVILKDVEDIKKGLNGLNLSIAKINNLKGKEDVEFKKWQLVLDDMRKKFLFVDESLFKSAG